MDQFQLSDKAQLGSSRSCLPASSAPQVSEKFRGQNSPSLSSRHLDPHGRFVSTPQGRNFPIQVQEPSRTARWDLLELTGQGLKLNSLAASPSFHTLLQEAGFELLQITFLFSSWLSSAYWESQRERQGWRMTKGLTPDLVPASFLSSAILIHLGGVNSFQKHLSPSWVSPTLLEPSLGGHEPRGRGATPQGCPLSSGHQRLLRSIR